MTMIKNQSNLYPFAIQDQLSNGLTGQTPSVFLRQDNGSFTAASGSVTEVDSTNYPGLYQITLTAAECNCDVLTIAVSLPDGQEPAILDVVYPVTTGGATPAEIWGYNGQGGRTVTNTIPTASDNAQAVWGTQTKEVTIATAQAETFATASALTTVGNNVSAVKAKTDNLPQSPAAVGSEMALTSAAITAVQNGLSTFNASTDTVTLNATEDGTLTAIKTKVDTLSNTDLTGIATATDVSNAQTAIIARGNEAWTTATGFTVPADLANLATTGDISSLASYGDTKWLTATGFATPSDIPTASDNASSVWSANSRTLTESALTAADVWSYSSRTLTASALTAQQVWEYGTRTLTASPTDISGLATSQDIADLQTHGDSAWNTATGFATPTNVSDAKADIISAIPTDYAKPGNAMTLTSSTLASVVAGVWNYDNRELTQEIVSQVTAEDIASISIAVWSYVPRKLTSIVSDVIEPNK